MVTEGVNFYHKHAGEWHETRNQPAPVQIPKASRPRLSKALPTLSSCFPPRYHLKAMASSAMTLLSLIFLLFLSQTHALPLSHSQKRPTTTPSKLVRSSCSHAQYPNVCLHTLSSLSPPPNSLPSLAQAAVSLTLSRARKATTFVSSILPTAHGKRDRAALRDCAEQLSDCIDELRHSLSELRHLHPATFRWQMSNAQTWVSAALTNEDTCLDGFQGVPRGAKAALKKKIRNIARVTSNALYLINRVADTRRTVP